MKEFKFEDQPAIETQVGSSIIQISKLSHVLDNNEDLTDQRRKELQHDLKRNMDVFTSFWQRAASCEYASIDEGEFELAADENLQVPIIGFSTESE